MTKEKMLAAVFVVLCLITAAFWVVAFWQSNSITSVDKQYYLKAMVKGSIYETGEYMSVFGTCSDSNDIPVENATALFSAWYPNGTNYLMNQSMSEISTGYFLWQGSMTITGGTYLTRFECQALNQSAFAFGEWQNPVWVNRVAQIALMTNNTWALLYDLNGTIIGINNTVSGINVTVTNINDTTNEILSIVRQISITGLRRLYFYNVTDSFDYNYTIMNGTVPDVSNFMRADYGPLVAGEHELARRIYSIENLTEINQNLYKQHTTLNFTSGTKSLRLHSELYIRNIDGSLELIGQSNPSDILVLGYQDVDWVGTISMDHILIPGEYLVMILNATVSGGGSNPSATLVIGGDTGASLEIGTNAQFAINAMVNLTTVYDMLSAGFNTTYSYLQNLTNITTFGFNTTYSWMSNLTNLTSSGFNSTYQNITYMILNTTGNANNTNNLINQSFNSNTTYLAWLLLQLINITTYDPTMNVTWREEYDEPQPRYWHNWKIKTYVYDLNNRSVGHPDVDCTVQMTQDGRVDPLVNMAWKSGGLGDDGSDQADSEGYFYATVFINGREVSWVTNCFSI